MLETLATAAILSTVMIVMHKLMLSWTLHELDHSHIKKH